MFTCPVCKCDCSDGVKCSKCLLTYCFSCAHISESNYRKLGAVRQAALLCTSCKTSPVHASVASPVMQPCAPSTATLDVVLQELRNGIHGINARLDQLPAIVQDIQNIKENLLTFEGSMCTIKKEVKVNSSNIAKVEKRVDLLENQPSAPSDYPQLKMQIAKLLSEAASKDQTLRINNIEIKGIPIKKNENLFELVCKIGELVGQPIMKSDINFITRARSTTQPKPIIVGFLGRYLKENVVASARARKPSLVAEDLGFTGCSTKIYINDHLTRENKQLLTSTKKAALEKNYRYVWVQNCRILIRKNDTSPIVAIYSDTDLSKIK